jgi:type VI protein secretion system component VasK
MMDEKLQRKLVRQIRIINVWMTIIGTFILGVLIACGWVLIQVWSLTKNTTQTIDSVKQSLDVKKTACNGDTAFSKYLQQNTEACK